MVYTELEYLGIPCCSDETSEKNASRQGPLVAVMKYGWTLLSQIIPIKLAKRGVFNTKIGEAYSDLVSATNGLECDGSITAKW